MLFLRAMSPGSNYINDEPPGSTETGEDAEDTDDGDDPPGFSVQILQAFMQQPVSCFKVDRLGEALGDNLEKISLVSAPIP